MVSIADFPVDAMTWGDPSVKGVFKFMQGSHPKGYLSFQMPPASFQMPPATLDFDVEVPKSPRMKLRVTGDVIRPASTHRKSGCSPTTPDDEDDEECAFVSKKRRRAA